MTWSIKQVRVSVTSTNNKRVSRPFPLLLSSPPPKIIPNLTTFLIPPLKTKNSFH